MFDDVYVHDMVYLSYISSCYPRADIKCLIHITDHR
jgi:hypothetical protein